MVLGVRRDGIVGAAAAHVVVIGLLVAPGYLVALKRASGVQIAQLARAILPSFVAASLAGVGADAVSSQFASPLAELGFGLAAGGLIYLVAVGWQLLSWLGPDRAAKVRTSRLFRYYLAVGRIVTVSAGPRPVSRSAAGRYEARHAASASRGRHAAAGRVVRSERRSPLSPEDAET
jgi:hypothetical protein